MTTMRIIGIYPVAASERCHLIEVELDNFSERFEWEKVTQEDPSQPRANWQVAYDETHLYENGMRWAFFFHYLDFSRPLITPSGPLELPRPTALPGHLAYLKYEAP